MQEDVYQGDGLNLYVYCHNNSVMYYDPSGYDVTKNPLFNSPEDVEYRKTRTPGENPTYGKWLGERGDSYFEIDMKNNNPKYKGLIDTLEKYGTTKVKYTNGMIDMEEFATFSVDTKIYSDRGPTHLNTNQVIAETIIKYKGDYEKMYNDNVMGIASGTKYSQSIAKEIIMSDGIQDAMKISNKELMNKAVFDELVIAQSKYKQTIHETNLEYGKVENTTQWVPSEINNRLRHMGGTAEQGKVEKMQQTTCSKKK